MAQSTSLQETGPKNRAAPLPSSDPKPTPKVDPGNQGVPAKADYGAAKQNTQVGGSIDVPEGGRVRVVVEASTPEKAPPPKLQKGQSVEFQRLFFGSDGVAYYPRRTYRPGTIPEGLEIPPDALVKNKMAEPWKRADGTDLVRPGATARERQADLQSKADTSLAGVGEAKSIDPDSAEFNDALIGQEHGGSGSSAPFSTPTAARHQVVHGTPKMNVPLVPTATPASADQPEGSKKPLGDDED